MANRSVLSEVFTFPSPVNEKAARTVAAGVVVMAALTVFTGFHVLVFLLFYGFLARVAAGPRFSPLGLLATKVIVPRLNVEPKMVAGPPKRFAQSIGLAFSIAAIIAYYFVGSALAGNVILSVLAIFAFLESALGFCAGCAIFAALMKTGLIPKEICLDCANIWDRQKSHAI